MRKETWLPVLAATALLGGCGGGGGGGSGVELAPPPPSPGNTAIYDLKQSQTLTGLSSSSNVAFDPASDTAVNGTAASRPLTVSYDSSSQSYTVSADGLSQTFRPADIAASSAGQHVLYSKKVGSADHHLTLIHKSVDGSKTTQHVGMGTWERADVSSGGQAEIAFDTFVYGFETPSATVPRTGTASYGTSVYGLTTTPGHEPRTFHGMGQFEADFATGIFSTHTYLTETEVFSGYSVSGGGLELTASGMLSSSDGSFSGYIRYGGFNVSLAGTLSGKFYGPDAAELGAAFMASNTDGSTATGVMTGWRDPTNARTNLTLTNLVAPQQFYTGATYLEILTFDGEDRLRSSASTITGGINFQTGGNLVFSPGISSLPSGAFTPASIVPSADPNFTRYEETFSGQPVRLELYKPGRDNKELQLTYASFGRWSSSAKSGVVTNDTKLFFTYGFNTPAGTLAARTGSAHYAGVVYGAGANDQLRERYDVSGTSQFDVNFSNQSFTGALALTGTASNGSKVDFGGYDFGGTLSARESGMSATIMQGGEIYGQLNAAFFGPTGEEIAGQFTMRAAPGTPGADTRISGVTVAKRQ